MKNLESLGLRVVDGCVLALDQRALPHRELWVAVSGPAHMAELIQCLAIRGAPLIGVAAALAIAQHAESGASTPELLEAASMLRKARPTAVNLMAAVDRVALGKKAQLSRDGIVAEAEAIFEEDARLSKRMAERGAEFIQSGDQILTHCNSGGLVTTGIGTALGAVIVAHKQGKKLHVFVDETRPLLQGARLTTWELERFKIPYTLICDNMAASLMSRGQVQKVFTGADRIAKNGDFANKIGTYSVAVNAHHHKIPFYVVAPRTTFDAACPTGKEIVIEERKAEEVRAGNSPLSCKVWNPAFDVTPRSLISGIVFDDGML